MNKVIRRAGIGLGVVVVGFVGGGFLLPSTAHVERSATVDATACNVSAVVDGFSWFNDWSPWAEIDPATTYTAEGPPWGPGAKFSWSSAHPDVGTGSQVVTAVDPCRRVDLDLDFGGERTAKVSWTLEPEGARTKATWTLDSELGMNVVARWFGLGFDRMIGPDYERGIEKLGALVARLPKADVGGLDVAEADVPARDAAVLATRSAAGSAAMDRTARLAIATLNGWAQGAGLAASGAPFVALQARDADGWAFQVGIPVQEAPPASAEPSTVTAGAQPAGRFLKVTHKGGLASADDTIAKLDAWAVLRRKKTAGLPWFELISDPALTPEAEQVVVIYQPLG